MLILSKSNGPRPVVQATSPYLRRSVEDGREIYIDIWSTTGERTIARADDVFSHISSKFWKWNLDVPARRTLAAKASAYDIVAPATLSQVFMSFKRPLRGISPTQHQIVECVARNQALLFGGGEVYGVFFLFGHQYDSMFFPAYVSRELRVTIRPMISALGSSADEHVWKTEHPRRVVILE